MEWVSLSEVIDVLNDPEWEWWRNSKCKYLVIRLDMRDGKCLISDRNGKPLTVEELKAQFNVGI